MTELSGTEASQGASYDEPCECVACGAQANAVALSPTVMQVPPDDWWVIDTYPSGDMGPSFACSELCARRYQWALDRTGYYDEAVALLRGAT